MPKFSPEPGNVGSTFGFSAIDIDKLKATEYTLVNVAVDVSGSTAGFTAEMEVAIKAIVTACRRSPRADNLLLRLGTFDHHLTEVHGFKLLQDCNPGDYTGILTAGGSTALFDAAVDGIDAVARYGRELADNDFQANGICFVITDGDNNASTLTVGEVKKAVDRVTLSEALESLVTVLIGVNVTDPHMSQRLADFRTTAGFTQYVDIGAADERKLARLADFVSRSISSQSQSLGSGGPSKALTF